MTVENLTPGHEGLQRMDADMYAKIMLLLLVKLDLPSVTITREDMQDLKEGTTIVFDFANEQIKLSAVSREEALVLAANEKGARPRP